MPDGSNPRGDDRLAHKNIFRKLVRKGIIQKHIAARRQHADIALLKPTRDLVWPYAPNQTHLVCHTKFLRLRFKRGFFGAVAENPQLRVRYLTPCLSE